MAETRKPSREAEILDAAIQVFLRHGFRKTSMDEVARAAGLSRQALYLRFAGKRELFQATVERMIGQVRAAALAALDHEGRAPADRLADALTALNGDATGASGVVIRELLQETAGVSGPLLDRLRGDVTAAIADLLRRTGIAERWQDAGLTADELAEHLYLIPPAVALDGQDAAEQRRALYTAARVITRGHPG